MQHEVTPTCCEGEEAMSNYEDAVQELYAVGDPTLPGWDMRLSHATVGGGLAQEFYLARPGRLEMQRTLVLNTPAVQTAGDLLTEYVGAVRQQQRWTLGTTASPRLWLVELDCRDGALTRSGAPSGRSGAAMRASLAAFYDLGGAGVGANLDLPEGGSYNVYLHQWHERLQTDCLPNLGWLVTVLLLEHLAIG